jgi:hypothetical protein
MVSPEGAGIVAEGICADARGAEADRLDVPQPARLNETRMTARDANRFFGHRRIGMEREPCPGSVHYTIDFPGLVGALTSASILPRNPERAG